MASLNSGTSLNEDEGVEEKSSPNQFKTISVREQNRARPKFSDGSTVDNKIRFTDPTTRDNKISLNAISDDDNDVEDILESKFYIIEIFFTKKQTHLYNFSKGLYISLSS